MFMYFYTMKDRKNYWWLILGGLFLVILILFGLRFPIYRSRIPVMGALVGFDVLMFYVLKLRLPKSWWLGIKWLHFIPLTCLASYFLVGIIFHNLPFSSIIITYWIGFIMIGYMVKMVMMVILFLGEIKRLIVKRKALTMLRTDKMAKVSVVFGGVTLILLFYGMVFCAYDFEVKSQKLKIPKYFHSKIPMRMVQISDVHLGSWCCSSQVRSAVHDIMELKPDIIVFTGDMVNYETAEAYPFVQELLNLNAPLGIYAVLGNHDYGEYKNWKTQEEKDKNLTDLELFYDRMGWRLLRNEHVLIPWHEDSIVLAGVENWSHFSRFGQRGDLGLALKGAKKNALVILLSHDPTHWQYEVSEQYPSVILTLSGHTHAMQMGIELLNFRWSPAGLLYKYWAGFYEKDNMLGKQYLYVNRGLGNIAYPGRLGIRPEITFFEISD